MSITSAVAIPTITCKATDDRYFTYDESNNSYNSEASQQRTSLSKAIGQDEVTREKLLHALDFSGGDWFQKPAPKKLNPTTWVSDHSGECELRFLIQAQPDGEENSRTAVQNTTSRLTADIEMKYGPRKFCLEHMKLIGDFFFPSDPQGNLASWHSFATSKTMEKWKIYLNPRASGMENTFNTTQQALERLGLTEP
ncbi:Aromatic prenyltransferase DMATS type [Penicillium angulare]|uniref:Aromatic prenyltransferase DMATS type n=1 Tax=Penicillium angulare TaxID=116970 RepID=UPI00254062D8|nr:Aromatic prenyltransferase DMATS type [Penicillium angulare]KAJ5291092.1 Aromatic prenyltransferase DMATS type [Penicillium angulare]